MSRRSDEMGTALAVSGRSALADLLVRFQRDRFAGQLSRYTLISVVALALDFAVFLGLAASGTGEAWAAAAGYSAGLVLHYMLSVAFVFRAARTGKTHLRLFLEFVFSGLAGLITTVAIVSLAVDAFDAPASIAKLCAVGASFGVTFALRRYLVFAWADAPRS